jgi:hypothetical protein
MDAPADPPVMVWPLHYIVFGTAADKLPPDLFENPASLMAFQQRICEAHLAASDDDFVPYLTPYFGTGVLASAFGVQTRFAPGRDPSAGEPVVHTPAAVAHLRLPDPQRDGLMPRVLEAAAYMRAHGDYPVALTDMQSPLDELVLMCGHERLYLWMYDEPTMVHDLFTLVTDAFIAWVRTQKAVTGEPLDVCHGEQGVWIPSPCGVWLADDEAVNLPPYLYEEFIAPQYERVFASFGGGVLHFCGNGAHLGPIIRRMRGVRAVNTGPMGRPENLARLQAALGGAVPIIYQELAPAEPEAYYRDLLGRMSLRGLVIAPQVTDRVAGGPNGAFVAVEQERERAGARILAAIRAALAAPGSPPSRG